MRLTGLSYKTTNWELEEIEFDEVSLIVGKNATGKTRTLAVLHLLYEIITQKREIFESGEWEVHFTNGEDNYIYKFQTEINDIAHVIYEELTINERNYIFRKNGEDYFRIRNSTTKKLATGTPPSNKLVINVARDVKKYPFIEEIIKWAEQSYGFRFSNVYPKYGQQNIEYGLLAVVDPVSKLLLHLEPESRSTIISELTTVGFAVEKINLFISSTDNIDITINEQNVVNRIAQGAMSQGLFRSISVLIFVEYLIVKKSTATIIIDDLCEGLDYERATKLGRLLFDKCLANNIQLIATSNDMFLMDVVDLKYWNVLQRNGQVVTAINAKNHPGLFEDFKFTGLSNFDFFASDYIAQNL